MTDLREALTALAEWPCQKYNPPHDCGRVTGNAPLPCGPCTARSILAIEDQAATEARRELLAALEGLPQSDVGAMYPAGWNAALAAVLRLIEERP